MKEDEENHLLVVGEESVVAGIHLQPVAADDSVVHHEAKDERQLGFEDLVLVEVDSLDGGRRRNWLAQLLRALALTVVLEVGRSDTFLRVRGRKRRDSEKRAAGSHVGRKLESQFHVLLLVLVIIVDGASFL